MCTHGSKNIQSDRRIAGAKKTVGLPACRYEKKGELLQAAPATRRQAFRRLRGQGACANTMLRAMTPRQPANTRCKTTHKFRPGLQPGTPSPRQQRTTRRWRRCGNLPRGDQRQQTAMLPLTPDATRLQRPRFHDVNAGDVACRCPPWEGRQRKRQGNREGGAEKQPGGEGRADGAGRRCGRAAAGLRNAQRGAQTDWRRCTAGSARGHGHRAPNVGLRRTPGPHSGLCATLLGRSFALAPASPRRISSLTTRSSASLAAIEPTSPATPFTAPMRMPGRTT